MITTRLATTADIDTIAAIGSASYTETFGYLFTDSELSTYLHSTYSVEKITSSMEKSVNRYFMVELDGEPIGFMKLKYPCLHDDLTVPRQMQLQKIYVKPGVTGNGAGTHLMKKCAEEARHKSPITVWLMVHVENERAIRFYHRFGYQDYGQRFFDFGSKRIYFRLMVKEY
ncbi:GNAT family N-acetyltransferase [candidate division KSB1 bacterium]|nr:GNAT family N-acetyltransferase [candidate division KSB1 bacterium]